MPILSRINPIPHIDTYFFKIHSNIVAERKNCEVPHCGAFYTPHSHPSWAQLRILLTYRYVDIKYFWLDNVRRLCSSPFLPRICFLFTIYLQQERPSSVSLYWLTQSFLMSQERLSCPKCLVDDERTPGKNTPN